MLKELLNGSARIGISQIEMKERGEVQGDKIPELNFSDSVGYAFLNDRLRVEGTRALYFEPESNFELTVTYFVEHFLQNPGSLESVDQDKAVEEISDDLGFYLQNNQGISLRVSLLIGEITSSFGGAPVITSPMFPVKGENGDDKVRMICLNDREK